MSIPPITQLPSIPSVPSSADAQTRQFLTAVKGILETYQASRPNASILDKVLTNRDLYDSGLGAVNLSGRVFSRIGAASSSGSGLQAGDYTPPPPITNFTASPAIMSVILSWTAAPASANIASYEIWRSGSNNLGTAVKVLTTPAEVITDSVGAAGVTYYYWIRAVSRVQGAPPGPFNAVSGTVATTGYVTGADVVNDTTPPGAPTSVTTTGMLKHIVVQWVNPAGYDISVVEVWRNTTNDRATSAKVGESRGTVYFDATVGTYYYWIRAIDSSANVGPFNAAAGATGILGSSVTITSGNATTYMALAAIDSALIANLTVDKLLSGTMTSPTIYLGDTTFKLDGPTRLLTIKDQQGTPVDRVKLGKLGAGASDYGIEIRDAAGAVVIGATGLGLAVVGNTQLQNLAVDSAKVSSLTVDKLRTGTFGAYQINVGASQITIDGADSTIKVFDTQATPVNRVKIGKLGVGATDYGIQIYDNAGSLIVGNTGLGLNVVGTAQIQSLAVGDAQINNVAVNKLLAGTIGAQIIYLGNTSFKLDGGTKRLTVSDGTYNRVELGDLGSGAFGLILRDASGATFLNSGGVSTVPWANIASRPANVAALTGSEGIQNVLLSLSASGVLSGGGGGAVQLGSLPGVAASTQMGAGVGVNQVPNSDFRFNASRHSYQTESGTVNFGRNLSASWFPPGEGALYLHQPDGTTLGQARILFGVDGLSETQFYKVVPGKKYEASAYTGAHRCLCEIWVVFYDSAGAFISGVSGSQNNNAASGGTTLAGYLRLSVFATAPANAATALPFIRKYPTIQGQGYTDSYAFVSRAYFGEAYPNQTEPSPWSGVTTGQFSTLDQINATNISTYIASAAIGDAYIDNLSANKITAGTISAAISITAPTITGGTISAGTITGTIYQTAASGERIDINTVAGRLRFIDSAGVVRARIGYDASDVAILSTTAPTNQKGIYIVADNKFAIHGVSTSDWAIYGDSGSSFGVIGKSGTSIGVYGYSTSGIGVNGNSGSSTSWDFYANGAGVNYGPFTGGHDGLVPHSFTPVVGDIVCDREVIAKKNVSNTICRVDYTLAPQDVTAVGVLVGHSEITEQNMPAALIVTGKTDTEDAVYIEPLADLQAKYKRVTFNAVGEGMINVCNEGGNIQAGDYICASSVKGKGMKQSDGVYRNYTVARARESAAWDNGSNVFKQIACIYLAG